MGRKAAFFGFLAIQAVSVALWVSAAMPFLTRGQPLVETAQQIWSGGGYSELDGSFRTGRNVVLAPTFEWWGVMLQGTLFMLGAGAAAIGAIVLWRLNRTWFAVAAAVAALLLGAAGNWFIATQWQGDTAFPPGYLDSGLLYSLSRAFNMQFYIGFALLAVSTVLVIAGVATRERALGFQVVALNWVVIVATWSMAFWFLFVAPHPGKG